MRDDSPLIEALALWAEITGQAVPKDEHDYGGVHTLGSLDVRRGYEQLKEALELDPSEVTANLLFSVLIKDYVGAREVSMSDLLKDPEKHLAVIAKIKKLEGILERDEIVQERTDFIEFLRQALKHYGVDGRKDVEDLLANYASVAILRRDALRSIERLRVDQFLQGAPEEASVKPGYITIVHEWWNINSLLSATVGTPSGVSLNLIRDPNGFDSYFAFALRNGANLFILTDVPEYAHPLGGEMSRRPDRRMAERIGKNWFPYDLLDLKVSEKGDLYFQQWSDSKVLVPHQGEAKKLAKIADIAEPAELVWTVMMLQLIVQKFWAQGYQAPALSFTGEMVKVQDALMNYARHLPVAHNPVLELPTLTLADISGPGLDPTQIGKTYNNPNAWLEERYAHRVPEEAFNLVATGDRVLQLEHKTGEFISKTAAQVKSEEFHRSSWFEREKPKALTTMRHLPATRFGSPEALDADRRFLARHNLAERVHELAAEEYHARKEEITKWYQAKAKANLPTLLTWLTNEMPLWIATDDGRNGGSYEGQAGMRYCFDVDKAGEFEDGFTFEGKKVTLRSFIRSWHLPTLKAEDSYARLETGGGYTLGTPIYNHRGVWQETGCAVNGTMPTHLFRLHPAYPDELAMIAGVKIEDLPDVLQGWNLEDDYTGNSILDRIDPMIWNAKNPWRNHEFRIKIPLSIRGMWKVEKMARAVPPLRGRIFTEAERLKIHKGTFTSSIKFGGKS